jgi:hypothetical protein
MFFEYASFTNYLLGNNIFNSEVISIPNNDVTLFLRVKGHKAYVRMTCKAYVQNNGWWDIPDRGRSI